MATSKAKLLLDINKLLQSIEMEKDRLGAQEGVAVHQTICVLVLMDCMQVCSLVMFACTAESRPSHSTQDIAWCCWCFRVF